MIPLAVSPVTVHSARMRERLLRLARFCTVGLICLGIALSVLAGLHDFAGVNYLIAYVASFVVSNIAGYLLNARFTFSTKAVDSAGLVRYMTVNASMLGANTLAMKLLVDVLHVWYLGAAILLAAVNTPISFFGQRLFTYRARAAARRPAVL